MNPALQIAIGTVSSLWLIATSLSLSYLLAWRIIGRTPSVWLRFSGVVTVGMWLATVGFHALFSVGLWSLSFTLLAVGACAGFALYRQRTRLHGMLRRDRRALLVEFGSKEGRRAGMVLLAAAPFILILVARTFVEPPLGWDWHTYRGTRATFLLQGDWTIPDSPGAWGLCRHYLAGSEVLTAWAMLPFSGFELAGAESAVQWLANGLVMVTLARTLSVPLDLAVATAIAGMFVPTMQLEVGSGYSELALNVGLLLSWCFFLEWMRKGRESFLWLGAAGAGLAIGIKLNGLLPALAPMMLVAFVAALFRTHRRGLRPTSIAITSACLLLPALPWLLLAIRDTGYPLSPAPISVFGIPLGVANPEMEGFLNYDVSAAYSWGGELSVLEDVFDPLSSRRHSLGILTIVPIVLSALAMGREFIGRRFLRAALLLTFFVTVWAVFFQPGLSIFRLYWKGNTSRYLLPLIVFAFPVSGALFRGHRGLSAYYLFVLCLFTAMMLIRFCLAGTIAEELTAVLAIAASLGTVAFLMAYFPSGWLRIGLATTCVAFAIAFGAQQGLQLRQLLLIRGNQLHHSPRFWANAIPHIDEPSVERRIAVTAGKKYFADHWFSTYFAGRRLQNELTYVPITEDGTVYHPGPGRPARRTVADRSAWFERIRASGITEVVTFTPRSIEQGWMEASGADFEKLTGDHSWGLFRVKAR